ncbi:MAG TPA: ABC transporter permease [Chloroflexota bacterium]|nr:ABC transporter permease [Chloroflexota bacterium]
MAETAGIRASRPLWWLWLALVYLFLFAPLFVVALLSFNKSPYGTLPFHWAGAYWYHQLFAESDLISSTQLSVELSLAVAAAGTTAGTLAAVALTRYRFRLRGLLVGALPLPIVVPWLVLGIALLLIVTLVGLGRGWPALFLGNLAVVIPYVVIIVSARLRDMDPSLEEASRSLGAGQWTTLCRVTLPLALPGVLGGALMAFVVCFNNFTLQYFLAPYGVETLPLSIYNLIRVGYRPDVNALSTILLAAALILLFFLDRLSAVPRGQRL